MTSLSKAFSASFFPSPKGGTQAMLESRSIGVSVAGHGQVRIHERVP